METPLLKRRLNPFLLVSTVLVLSLLAGMSVLYQSQLNDLVSSNKNLEGTLEEKNSRISTLEAQVANMSSTLEDLNQSLQQSNRILREERNESEQRQSTIETLENIVSSQNNTIQSLQGNLTNLTQHADAVNQSLEFVCTDGATNLSSASQSECSDWGY